MQLKRLKAQAERYLPASFAVALWLSSGDARGATWAVSQRMPLGTPVVRVISDARRACAYAIDRQNSNLLFIDLQTGAVQNTLYVGKDPSDFDIDATGDFLYVANKGPGTGLYGSWRIGVVALTNQTLVTSYITLAVAENVVAGRPGRLYYNSAWDDFNGGDVHSLNTDSGVDLGSFGIIKSHMVTFANKTRLFGQYTYTGNLGAMGDFDISSDQIALRDTAYYSPYPYGWDYDNYSLSGDDRVLAYGKVLFNPTNFASQLGVFQEQVYALNGNGSIAFGQASVWDTTTFALHGDATGIAPMPFSTTVMSFDSQANVLYAFNPSDKTLCTIEQTTTHGIPFRWLSSYGLSTNDEVELQDTDDDGYTNLQEWLLAANPTNTTAPLSLTWSSATTVSVAATSPLRTYELQRSTSLMLPNWQPVVALRGSGGALAFDLSLDKTRYPTAFYRLRPGI